jgi:hypothetical protein
MTRKNAIVGKMTRSYSFDHAATGNDEILNLSITWTVTKELPKFSTVSNSNQDTLEIRDSYKEVNHHVHHMYVDVHLICETPNLS